MPNSLATIIPVLTFLASASGAGLAASFLLSQARSFFPRRHNKQVAALPALHKAIYCALYSPRYARQLVFVVAALNGVGFTALLALATQQPILPAIDQALAATLAVVVSQILHSRNLSKQPAYTKNRRKHEAPDHA